MLSHATTDLNLFYFANTALDKLVNNADKIFTNFRTKTFSMNTFTSFFHLVNSKSACLCRPEAHNTAIFYSTFINNHYTFFVFQAFPKLFIET